MVRINAIKVIDESMAAFTGRSKMKFYIPQKPTKWGFKIHVLSESETGYALNLEMDPRKHQANFDQEPFTVEMQDKLIPKSLNNKYYVLFTDSWYTSLPSILLMKQRGIYVA